MRRQRSRGLLRWPNLGHLHSGSSRLAAGGARTHTINVGCPPYSNPFSVQAAVGLLGDWTVGDPAVVPVPFNQDAVPGRETYEAEGRTFRLDIRISCRCGFARGVGGRSTPAHPTSHRHLDPVSVGPLAPHYLQQLAGLVARSGQPSLRPGQGQKQ